MNSIQCQTKIESNKNIVLIQRDQLPEGCRDRELSKNRCSIYTISRHVILVVSVNVDGLEQLKLEVYSTPQSLEPGSTSDASAAVVL